MTSRKDRIHALVKFLLVYSFVWVLGITAISEHPDNPILMNHPTNWTIEWVWWFIGVVLSTIISLIIFHYLQGDFDSKHKETYE